MKQIPPDFPNVRTLRWYAWVAYRRLWWLVRMVLALTGIMVTCLYLLFQVPIVQQWLVRETADALARRAETPVTIGYFRMGFFNNITLGDFYVADHQGDTLVYLQKLRAQLDLSPISLLRRGLVITDLTLQRGRLYIARGAQAPRSTLEEVLERLIQPRKRPNRRKEPFRMVLRRLMLNDVALLKDDFHRGQKLTLQVGNARVQIDEMDLSKRQIKARFARFNGIQLAIEERPYGPNYREPLDTTTTPADTTSWKVSLLEFRLRNSQFALHNYRSAPQRSAPDNVIDFKHLDVSAINIAVDHFQLAGDVFKGVIRKIAFKEGSGFVLEKLAAQEAQVSSAGILLNGTQLITPYSSIGDTLQLRYQSYDDFGDFANAVRMEGHFREAKIAIRDIMAFAGDLNTNPFFRKNRETVAQLDGLIRGTLNNLDGRNLTLLLPDGTYFKGKFDSRDLGVKDEESLQLRVNELRTSMVTLRELLPNFNLPQNFNKLGRLGFAGNFTGFFSSFSLEGILTSNLGAADLNLSINLIPGLEKAPYQGDVKLRNFDLGAWTGNPLFGRVTLDAKITNGLGLAGPGVQADVSANLASFYFKNYNYANAKLSGQLKSRQFDGQFAIRDPHVDFDFAGKIDFSGDAPLYRFNAGINTLDLQKLNFTRADYLLTGAVELDLQGKNLADLTGKARFLDFDLNQGDQTYHFDSINLESAFDTNQIRTLTLRSDVADAEVIGSFDLEKIPKAVQQLLVRDYPGFAHRSGLRVRDTLVRPMQFTYDLSIKDSRGLHELIHPNLGSLQAGSIRGAFDNSKGKLLLKLQFPQLRYGDVRGEDLQLTIDLQEGSGSIDAGVGELRVNEKQRFPAIKLVTLLDRDTLDFGLIYKNDDSKELARLDIDGRVFVRDSSVMQLSLSNSELVLLEQRWAIAPNNTLVITRDRVDVNDFVLTQNGKSIRLEEKGRRGVKLELENLPVAEINDLLQFNPLQFGGSCNVVAEVGNLIQLEDIKVSAHTDTLRINGKDWGVMNAEAYLPNRNSPASAFFSLTQDSSQLTAEMDYWLRDLGENENQRQGYFRANLYLESFPLNFAEYFVGNTLKDIYGSMNADIQFSGRLNRPATSGNIYLNGGGLSVDYTKTHYTFLPATVTVDDYLFDASEVVLKDIYDNTALIYGGIRHDHLRRFGFNARIRTLSSFLALDTKKGDNQQFYGRALGRGSIVFSGSFDKPDIYVNASVGDSTRLIIPVSNAYTTSGEGFIKFVDKHQDKALENTEAERDISGVSFAMDLSANLGAVLQIIFNEQTGDIIQGQGKGAVQISVPRGGKFEMYGDITIEQGNYLFTFFGVVNKDFTIRKGGTLTWTGDPMGATIDLQAEYKNLNTSISNFIQEYLITNPNLQVEANNGTDVDLIMLLKGDLLHPSINFDIAFPSLQGQLQNLVENKLRSVQQDPNELNKQVFGLIVAGQFLPSDLSFQGSDIVTNTLSEFVSNQLSQMVSKMLGDLLGGRTLTSIDFDIAYSQLQSTSLIRNSNTVAGDVMQVSLQPRFLNDRLSVYLGGSFFEQNPNPTASGIFLGNDLIIEYAISPDRSLKLRIYQKRAPDVGGSRLQFGTGLSFSKEYDTFGEFIQSLRPHKKSKKTQ